MKDRIKNYNKQPYDFLQILLVGEDNPRPNLCIEKRGFDSESFEK